MANMTAKMVSAYLTANDFQHTLLGEDEDVIKTGMGGLDKDEEDKKGKYIRKERYAGAMQRSFYVGENLTDEDIKAKYENGILKLSVPKKPAKAVEAKKTIAIEG